jgi:hypothetical protein
VHPLAEIEAMGADPPSFSKEDRAVISKFKTPLERQLSNNPLFYPRKPKENVNQWKADHKERLRQLEQIAGMRTSREW